MTIDEAIREFDQTRPNQHDKTLKVRWLSRLDGMLWQEIFLTHEMPVNIAADPWHPYEADMDEDRQLLVGEPYDDIYQWWLACQSDLVNMEMQKHQNDSVLYNQSYQDFENYWCRTHLATTGLKRFYT